MIEIFSHRKGGKCRSFVTGHAEYCPGNDIVCAGVSALVCTLVQYATQSASYRRVRSHVQKGDAFFASADGAQDGFDMIVGGLAAIAAAYPDHVKVHSTVAE